MQQQDVKYDYFKWGDPEIYVYDQRVLLRLRDTTKILLISVEGHYKNFLHFYVYFMRHMTTWQVLIGLILNSVYDTK
jgi:hypothetical protein